MTLTPMMRQYLDTKEQVGDALLLFRMGDFYELFQDDAEEAARILGITLTSRDKGTNATPMAGFPYHALNQHLGKLLAAGRRVAICDQVEDPKQATGLVKREVTQIITPGTLTDDALLDPRTANYLVTLAAAPRGKPAGMAWLDVSTGRLTVADVANDFLAEELSRIEPSECLVPEENPFPAEVLLAVSNAVVTRRPPWTFARQNATDLLQRHFGVTSFAGFGVADDASSLLAAGALLQYVMETQRADLKHIARLIPYDRGRVMILDATTRRSLELTRTLRENKREGSLLATIDRTTTAAGARCLGDWLSHPLLDVEAIRYRQSAVAEWKDDPSSRSRLRELLRQTYDVERLAARVSTGRTSPRDLACLRSTLRWLPEIKAKLTGRQSRYNADLDENLSLFPELRARLEETLVDEPPIQLRDGSIIRDGYHAELDELRQIAAGGKQWIADFQRREAERAGIPTLKVGFNKVFGYYVEISNAHRDKIPEDFQRKQTLKNAERYITPELKEYEQKVLGAEERAKSLEYELFQRLRDEVSSQTIELQRLAQLLAELDTLLSLAELASSRQYVRPQVTEGSDLDIKGGRHPVLDVTMPAGRFIPNETRLDAEGETRLMLITGPNMAGKSTYIRQVALVTLLAQVGSFVPADSATIGVADRIFTRVGASDELGRGQSTFMVEMIETANILNNATAKSLVILDEIGRGTSTYDGVSLAWAIAEYLHDRTRCRTLFATHYHELIQLEETMAGLGNYNVAVREWKDEIIFLHQIVEGGADRSYGIHVAKLAGVPEEVLRRSQAILDQLERDPFGEQLHTPPQGQPTKHRRSYHQLSLFPTITAHPVLDQLRIVDSEELSEAEALALLRKLKAELAGDDEG
ncbi:DNA mismatch repair protein MutS [Planctomycetes bacterium Pan216]|uniref:DNA mismatch repair protein MutS n=1 Tax=Kolteria novifilia TaxID=2527975 RepID=A0A518AZA5_9BACT|nr:DNA mismatch repair protein MutS [Planctomycetes bacterium Pan216]